ncbi:unnamed protein product [Prorocentrum cordatum]|uniref:Peptidase C14 caspase domain-containing protein n=1 Tax=Prorocentrum cordatum TaxID=2364126 RepID=A0ABN9XWT1_9DINO|nr:unnamed protein product [Polarella glacialis]
MGQSPCFRMFQNDGDLDERTPLRLPPQQVVQGGLSLAPQQVVQVQGSSSGSPHALGTQFPQPPPASRQLDPHPPLHTPWAQRSSAPIPGAGAGGELDAVHGPLSGVAAETACHTAGPPSAFGPPQPAVASEEPQLPPAAAPATGAPQQAETAGHGGAAQPGVQLVAELPGRRRSLLVGINYFGTSSELSGCVNDILRVRPVLAEKWGFQQGEETQRVLLDSPDWPQHLRPTLANMRAAIGWLAAGAATGDALFFHYSGHGGREPRCDGSEGYHETLCPVDYETAGMLVDTELFDRLVKSLPAGCRLTCVLDCCHSAGALDLPYVFVGSKENLDKALAGEAMDLAVSKNWAHDMAGLSDGRPEALLGDLASMGLGLWELYRKRQATKAAGVAGFAGSEAAENAGLAVGEVIAFTGCRSDQTSADVGDVHAQFDGVRHVDDGGTGSSGCGHAGAHVGDHAGGALTAVFLESLADGASGELTYLSLLERMRQRLQGEGFSQVPQLASSLLVELQQRFSLTSIFLPPAGGSRGLGAGGGLDATDAALLGGTASCAAAGFLAAMASSHHGGAMLQGARAPAEWRAEGGCPELSAGQPLHAWGGGCDRDAAGSAAPLEPWGGGGSVQPPADAAGPPQPCGIADAAAPLSAWGASAPGGAEVQAGSAAPLSGWGAGAPASAETQASEEAEEAEKAEEEEREEDEEEDSEERLDEGLDPDDLDEDDEEEDAFQDFDDDEDDDYDDEL